MSCKVAQIPIIGKICCYYTTLWASNWPYSTNLSSHHTTIHLNLCCIISLARCLIYKAWFYWLFITLVVAHHLGIELFLFLFSVFCLHLVRRVLDITKLVGYWVVWWFIVTLVFGLYKGQRFPFVFLYILYFYILFFS